MDGAPPTAFAAPELTMNIAITRTLLSLSAVALALGLFASPASAQGRSPSDVPPGENATITRVIDGDTLEVKIDGQARTVKLLGINAPSIGECLGAQSRAFLANLLNVAFVRLERDVTDANAAGQLLRYIYRIDGRMANEELVKAGLARAEAVPPDTKHRADLVLLELDAAKARRGIWGACGLKPAQPAYSPTRCATFKVEDLITRVPRLPEQLLLRDGDCVNIVKDSNPAGPAWGGKYIYHPAGSTLALGNMYVRWKDGFVRILKDADGALIADTEMFYPASIEFKPGQFPRFIPPSSRRYAKALERDKTDPAIVRLPDEGAWLFRDLGQGKYRALVDVFKHVSGDINAPYVSSDGYVR